MEDADEKSVDSKAEATKPRACAEFLKNLPSYKKENFSRFVADTSRPSSLTARSNIRVICSDDSFSQVIVTEKTSIVLRYLHQQWDRKHNARKRPARQELDANEPFTCIRGEEAVRAPSSTQNGQPARKMPRTL